VFTIIQAKDENLQDTVSLFEKYRSFYNMPSNFDSARQFITERFSKRDSLIFLAFQKNTAVGFMQIYPSFSSVAMKPIWILNDLFIDSSVRRSGCATSMLQFLNKQAVKNKIFSIKLSTAVDNHSAKALYDSLGYKLVANFDNYSKTVELQALTQ